MFLDLSLKELDSTWTIPFSSMNGFVAVSFCRVQIVYLSTEVLEHSLWATAMSYVQNLLLHSVVTVTPS